LNTEEAGFDHMIAYQLEPELYSFKILESFSNYLLQQNIQSHGVHIKIDTGMHRLGFEPPDFDNLCKLLKHNMHLKILSVFSHLAGGGEAVHDQFTAQQAQLLNEAVQKIKEAIGYDFSTHIANSSAIHRHRDLQLNMVRLGIGMYGIDADAEMQDRLQNVTTLKTTISQVKKIKKGESVGYSRSAVANEDKIIATVRIGYADGYPRILSNGTGYMVVNGMPAPVIGKVCMDMTMLDITGIEAEEEDEVTVFGEALPVHKLASWAQTIEYEILTNISQRVRRVYFEE
jgi:Alr-MurF fusion protein